MSARANRKTKLEILVDGLSEKLRGSEISVESYRADNLPANVVLLDTSAMADLLKVSVAQVRLLAKAGELPEPFRLPGERLFRWRLSDVQRWISKQSKIRAGGLPI